MGISKRDMLANEEEHNSHDLEVCNLGRTYGFHCILASQNGEELVLISLTNESGKSRLKNTPQILHKSRRKSGQTRVFAFLGMETLEWHGCPRNQHNYMKCMRIQEGRE